ncbi:MAG TPA: ABC transporter ATP-binding protein [Acidocella sp.]|nr:ABC transporter ATP-binding protein [Acidocella sp.]
MANLQISRLVKFFGKSTVLRDVSFNVASGDLVAILGASGSGKTTLLRLIAGFEQPDGGEIRLDGEVMASNAVFKRPEQRGIGYVAQEGALFPHLSVADNITFGLNRAQRKARYRVAELLALAGLPAHYADRAPQQLSGGEQQRVALARALAPHPKLLLLDEPFSALDAGLRAETREAVASAVKASGATAILVTHDQEEALSMGRLVGVLQHGQLAQMSTPEVLYHHPASPDVADFVGDAVFTPGIAGNGKVHCALGVLRLAPSDVAGPVRVMIRPEQIRISEAPTAGGVPAAIKNMAFYGHDALVTLSIKGSLPVDDVTARVFSHAIPKHGGDVWLDVEGEVVAYPAASTAVGLEAVPA